ncbi:MAG TPA: S53 family peptidase [Solirubrobacteraceae bacterium]
MSASEYSVKPLCSPPSFGYAGCLGLRLAAKAPRAVTGARVLPGSVHSLGEQPTTPSLVEFKEPFAGSLTPSELTGAYGLDGLPAPATTQTIAIVDAFDDPTIVSDLAHYDKQFGLLECTTGTGCFRKINQEGSESPQELPASNGNGEEPEAGWALEISTDVEVAHSLCQSCHILLVEAASESFPDLLAAEQTAEHAGATEISDSWGGPECEQDTCMTESSAFEDPTVLIAVAAGDQGFEDWDAQSATERTSVDYPASSPHVVAVGGTRLLQTHGSWQSETVWNDGGQNAKGERGGYGASGGGCSSSFAAQAWQLSLPNWGSVGCNSHRAVADISADADPYTGVAIYDSTPVTEAGKEIKGWNVLGGTSVASPIVASIFALAGGANGVAYPAQTLYENASDAPASLHDVTSGSNGECLKPFNENTGQSGCSSTEQASSSCAGKLICLAHAGYDGPSGVGSPNGIAAFQPPSQEAKRQARERKEAEERVEAERRKREQEEAERQIAASGGSGTGTSGTSSGASSTTTAASGEATTSGTGGGTAGVGKTGTPNAAKKLVPVLSGLVLARSAIAALSHARPLALRLAFMFTLSAPARVRVTLAKEIRVHGRVRWQTLPDTVTITAAKGRDGGRLSAHAALARGRYRLTLTPARGVARALTFAIG